MYVSAPIAATRPKNRSAFFISDGTGITAETLGRSLLAQFTGISFDIEVIPFVDTVELAYQAVARINQAYQDSGLKPLVFDTIVSDEIRNIINAADASNLDIYEGIINKIAEAIGAEVHLHKGVTHGVTDDKKYNERIEAVHFALNNDDGATTRHYDQADIILVGLSRSGKTPTSLYLALQYGIRAANYPLTDDDLGSAYLPHVLKAYKNKIFGLTIDTDRLIKIRTERMAGTRYASAEQCCAEQHAITTMYANEHIPSLNVSSMSIEEIAARIIQMTGLKRRIG